MARTKSPSSKQKDPIASSTPVVPTPQVASAEILQKETPKPDTRKLEVVKPDSRRTIVPINLDEEIRRRAYELSERRGFEAGHEKEDWLRAEHEVRQRYHQQSA